MHPNVSALPQVVWTAVPVVRKYFSEIINSGHCYQHQSLHYCVNTLQLPGRKGKTFFFVSALHIDFLPIRCLFVFWIEVQSRPSSSCENSKCTAHPGLDTFKCLFDCESTIILYTTLHNFNVRKNTLWNENVSSGNWPCTEQLCVCSLHSQLCKIVISFSAQEATTTGLKIRPPRR